MEVRDNRLYLGGCAAEALAGDYGTPLYVYEEAVVRRQCRAFLEGFRALAPEVHYALKANPNPTLLGILRDEGIGIDAVSPFEVRLALACGFAPERIIFTGNNTTAAEMRECLERGVTVNAGSLGELERLGRLRPGGEVAVRLNPDVGAGHHPHVITGGPDSKFGIYHTDLPALQDVLARYRLELVGVHCHIGTGILDTGEMLQAMEIVLGTAARLPGLRFIDLGGGFGIPYRPAERPLPLAELGAEMARRYERFCAAYGSRPRVKLEPGRFLVGEAGTLLMRVTNLSANPRHTFVGTDSGFNHMARVVLYGAYHEILNASHVEGEAQPVVVAGNICETGDVFTQDARGHVEARPLSRPRVGDVLAVRHAGAYGANLASQYNLRPRPAEVLADGGAARLIRRRETYEDLLRGYVDRPAGE